MNIHPIVIHFPIAFLTLYAVLELIRFNKVLSQNYWFYVKAVLVIAGSLGTFVGVLTGALASGFAIGGPRIFALHQLFGALTLILSIISAKAYGLRWFWRENKFSDFILRPKVIVLVAILILISVTITGGLGGAMVRGTNFDPMMAPILKLLGVY